MNINKFINYGLNFIPDDPYGLSMENTVISSYQEYFEKILRMHNNENIIGVPEKVLKNINKIAPYSNIYPEGTHRAIREKLAEFLKLNPENFIITNGGDELIYYSAMAFINNDDEIILPRITFSVYKIAYKAMRAKIVNSEMNGLRIDLNDILNKITDKTKIIAICNPNNPTGDAIDSKSFLYFYKSVPSRIMVIIDEAYRDFVAIDDYPDSISLLKQGKENILILRTLSKSYGIAGLRVGYGIAHPSVINILNKVKLPFNISIISQFAALAALEDKDFYERSINEIKRGREYLYRELEELGLTYEKSNTNFILVHTRNKTGCIVKFLKERGILVLDTKGYELPSSIRVTLGSQKQNELFVAALKNALNYCYG